MRTWFAADLLHHSKFEASCGWVIWRDIRIFSCHIRNIFCTKYDMYLGPKACETKADFRLCRFVWSDHESMQTICTIKFRFLPSYRHYWFPVVWIWYNYCEKPDSLNFGMKNIHWFVRNSMDDASSTDDPLTAEEKTYGASRPFLHETLPLNTVPYDFSFNTMPLLVTPGSEGKTTLPGNTVAKEKKRWEILCTGSLF